MRSFLFLIGIVLLLTLGCVIPFPPESPENVTPPSPEPCPEIYSPVCGIDNETYQNSCHAQRAGITIAYSGECKEPEPTCSDSDAGKNVFEAGTTMLDSLKESDVCMNPLWVNEYYCQENQIVNETVACPSGYECTEGMCTELVLPPGCYDTDNGTDYLTAGTVYDQGKSYPDECPLISQVKEYYCKNGKVTSTNFACPSGYQCSKGACVEQKPICSDSDNGKDKFEKGTTWISKGFYTQTTAEDECADEQRVREYYCIDGSIGSQILDCEGEYGCDNGACRILRCEDSDGGKDLLTRGTTTKGTTSKEDSCSGTYNVEEFYCEDNRIRSTTSTCPPGLWCENGRCVSEPQCSETDGGYVITVAGTASKGTASKTDRCISTSTIEEHYCEANSIKTTTTSCPSGYWCKDNACVLEPSCSDSDGQDIYTAGTATKGTQSSPDSCQGSGSVIEYYCSNNNIQSTVMPCPSGYSCQLNACALEPQCSETDGGKDIYNYGTISKGTQSGYDWCSNDYTVAENYCLNNNMELDYVSCPSGYWCQDGECVIEPACSDSDGGIAIYTRGTISKGTESHSDYCTTSDTLWEYFCNGKMIDHTFENCAYGCNAGKCEPAPLCYDTDGGKNYLTKGWVDVGVDSIPDLCQDATTLIERFCVGDTYSSETVTCTYPNQVCSDGACVGIVLPGTVFP